MAYVGDGPKPELEVGDISTKDVTATGDVTISDKIIHSGDTNTAIRFAAADTVTVETAGSERMRVLSGGGITFNGDTATANALDDYEEGTWTPVVAAGWSSPSYAYQNGNYQKVGNLVEAFFFIQFSSSSSTGAHVQITGLPFTSVNETGGALRGGALTYFTTPVDAPGMVLAYVFQNATEFRLYHGNDGGASTLSNGAASLSFLIGSVVYRVS